MKWFEITEDLGDSSTRQVRFKTKEEALIWVEGRSDYPGELNSYPYSDIEEVRY
jgi:hypothetical protein